MKNAATFEIKDINIVVEGQPINIQGCTIHYENEASVQELATGASFIKDMIHEIKDFVKEAQASAQQQYNNRIADTPTSTATTTENKAETPKAVQHWDLPAIWSVMMKKLPEGFKKTGVGHYTYETGSLKEKNRIRVVIEFKADTIDCDITIGNATAFCHLYEDGAESYMSGINAALINDIIDALPEDIREYIAEYLKKITK